MDPWAVLGLASAGATADGVRAAKRRLAKVHHPDVVTGGGGGAAAVAEASARLAEVNRAAEVALADLATRRPVVARHRAPAGPATDAAAPHRPASAPTPSPAYVPMPAPSAADAAVWAAGEDEADATFSLDCLPVEAFELVLLAFSCIGDPKVVDEPYLLEGQVDDPFLGMARVELAPEAGSTLVRVSTWAVRRAPTPAPTAGQVAGRLLWEVRNLGGR